MSDIQIVKVIEQGPQGAPAAEDVLAQVQTGIGAATADVAAYRTDAVLARNAAQSAQYASERAREQSQAAASTAAAVYGFLADSVTSLAITTGDKTFTIPTGKAFAPGMPVRASSKANPDTQALIGVVKSYSGTTLVIAVASAIGDATRADWTIAVTGGALAPIGATQDAQAVVQMARLERALAAAGVSDESVLILDFIRGVHFASRSAVTASIMALIAALPGSSFSRASTATYTDRDGLMKTAAVNVPRIDHDPVTRQPRGMLAEATATNLIVQSETLSAGLGATFTADTGVDPRGTVTLDRAIQDTSTGEHVADKSASVTSGTVYTYSVFVRPQPGSTNLIRIRVAAGTAVQASFDPAAKAMTGGLGTGYLSCGSLDYGGGLYRIWITFTAQATQSSVFRLQFLNAAAASSFTGDGVSWFEAGYCQLEAGQYPTSYIPTGASTVVRAVDGLALGASSWFQQVGTILAEVFLAAPQPNATWFRLFGAVSGDDITVRNTGDSLGQAAVSTVGNPQVSLIRAGGALPAGVHRASLAYEPGSIAASWNGATAQSGTGVQAVPSGLTTLFVGAAALASEPLGGHVRRILIYPKRLPDTKLQALTNQSLWS